VWQTKSYRNAASEKVEKSALKRAQNLRRIHKNGAQNLQDTRAEFSIFGAEF